MKNNKENIGIEKKNASFRKRNSKASKFILYRK